MLKPLAITSLPIVFLCAVKDFADDTYNGWQAVVLALVALVPPALIIATAEWCSIRLRARWDWVAESPALGLVGLYVLASIAWAANGKTDPDTAGHLRWMIVPLAICLFGLLMLGPTVLYLLFRKTRPNDERVRTDES